jgi:hypothetical protein
MNRNKKLLRETMESGLSGLANRMVQFYLDRRQSEAPPSFNEARLLRPSDVWSEEKQEPWQLMELWWRIVDLIDKKKEKETKI